MTPAEGYKILGLRSSASQAKVDKAYAKKPDLLQPKLRPGIPREVRHKAASELAQVKQAHELVSNAPAKSKTGKRPQKQHAARAATPRPRAAGVGFGQGLKDWVSMIPLSRASAVLFLVFVFFTLTAMVSSCISSCIGSLGRTENVPAKVESPEAAREERDQGAAGGAPEDRDQDVEYGPSPGVTIIPARTDQALSYRMSIREAGTDDVRGWRGRKPLYRRIVWSDM